MAAKKAQKSNRPAVGDPSTGGMPGAAAETSAASPPSDDGSAATEHAPGGEGAPAPQAPQASGPGLDGARHAHSQHVAQQAEFLRTGVFPALMASALDLDRSFDGAGYRLFLEQMVEACGNPADPVERLMVEQLCLAHFRIAQVHVGAGAAKSAEAAKLYNAAAARLLGEFRRTALALHVLRGRTPEAEPRERLKVYKEAQ